jgi:hypothetical protein
VLATGDCVAVFRRGDKHIIRYGEAEFEEPRAVRFPIVRFLNPDTILLADSRTTTGYNNAWVFDRAGNLFASFCAGDAIADILGQTDTIVVTYFDEGVFGNVPPAQEGVCVYSATGRLRFGYTSEFGEQAVSVADCYCACWGQGFDIWFSPYADFPLVKLDVVTREQEVFSLPSLLTGAKALTTDGNRFFFHDPDGAILSWRLGVGVKSHGTCPDRLRGLRGGRFLFHGTSGYTLVTPTFPL